MAGPGAVRYVVMTAQLGRPAHHQPVSVAPTLGIATGVIFKKIEADMRHLDEGGSPLELSVYWIVPVPWGEG